MTLRTSTATFTDTKADERERIITNSSSTVTIGGRVKSQADSKRLAITVKHRLTKAQYDSLATILYDFSQTLYYTPSHILLTKSAIAEIEVVAGEVTLEDYAYNGQRTLFVSYELQEVIA